MEGESWTLKDITYLGKNCFLIFWVPIFLHPNAVIDVRNSLYWGWHQVTKEKNCENHKILKLDYSPQNLPWQLAIAEGFAEANNVFIVITSAKILPRWLVCSKIYIQFTIFNTYVMTKLSFTNKKYHLHVLEKCLYVL